MGAYPQAEEEFRAAVRLDPGNGRRLARPARAARRHHDRAAAHVPAPATASASSAPATAAPSTPGTGWAGGCSRCWRARAICCSRTPRTGSTAAMSPELDRALAGLPPVDTDPQVRFLHACRAYLVKDWEQLVGTPNRCSTIRCWASRRGCSAAWPGCAWRCTGRPSRCSSAALMRCRSEQPQRKELRYWLARAHEGTGRSAAALPLYRAVHRIDPAFMDTSARLAAIAEGDGLDDDVGRPRGGRARPGVGAGRARTRRPDGVDPARSAPDGRDLGRVRARETRRLPGGACRLRRPAPAGAGARAVVPVQPAPPRLPAGPHRSGAAGRGARRAGADGRPGAGQAPGARRCRRS